MHILDKESF